jgi:hypothetical protein
MRHTTDAPNPSRAAANGGGPSGLQLARLLTTVAKVGSSCFWTSPRRLNDIRREWRNMSLDEPRRTGTERTMVA